MVADIDWSGSFDYERNWILTISIFAGGCFTAYTIGELTMVDW